MNDEMASRPEEDTEDSSFQTISSAIEQKPSGPTSKLVIALCVAQTLSLVLIAVLWYSCIALDEKVYNLSELATSQTKLLETTYQLSIKNMMSQTMSENLVTERFA